MLRSGVSDAIEALGPGPPEATRHAWVLLQVTRLLFLRFVESEGWLDGRREFLGTAVDHALACGRPLESTLFAPLFFGTLNRPVERRSRLARAFGAIPFLNGGLFEPHPVELQYRWSLPVAAWRPLLDLLLQRFEVTLDPDHRGDAVTPELMGRVFEGVMDPEIRRDQGTYYTPPDLVKAMLRDAIAAHLAPRLERPEGELRHALDAPDPPLRAALHSLSVLDPACGSGAFLVGALQLLAGAHPSPALVRHIVTRRIFGCDKNPAAIRIAELRLWLELLRASRGQDARTLAPLPNLDAAVRAGDALLDPFAGTRLPPPLIRRLRALQRHAARSHGATRRRTLARLRRVERRAAVHALELRLADCRARLADLREQRDRRDLFGEQQPPGHRVAIGVAALCTEMQQLRSERRQLALEATVPAFGLEAAFAGQLARGGFDLVIGNPPWVRAERLDVRTRSRLAERYRWWHGRGAAWCHPPDLSVAFVERGFELLASGGTMAFLIPSKFVTADYAAIGRAALIERATLHTVADLSDDPRAGFDATTYPLALLATRRRAAPDHLVRQEVGAHHGDIPQRAWSGRRAWSLGAPAMQLVAQRVDALPTLAASMSPSLGVKTGANHVFLDPDPSLDQWCRPGIRGRDVKPLASPSSVRLLWAADAHGNAHHAIAPELQRHFARHRATLESRRDFTGGPCWQLFRTRQATAPWRVVWADLARTLQAAALTDAAAVPLNSCYVVAAASRDAMHAIAAWLNAAPIRALARLVAESAANGYARFGARAVGSVPLPPGAINDTELAALGQQAWCPAVAEAIDSRVADILNLSRADLDAVRAFLASRR